jgi:hypothetical protein
MKVLRLYRFSINYNNGRKEWYQYGKLHRTNGPAITTLVGNKFWYQNGELHRIDGPAIKYISGTNEWWQNGQLHRTGGPAIEHHNGDLEWWYKGICTKIFNKQAYINLLKVYK